MVKFFLKPDNRYISFTVELLESAYEQRGFGVFFKDYINSLNENVFMSDENKKLLKKTIDKNLNLISKFRKLVFLFRKKKARVVNQRTLTFLNFDEIPKDEIITIRKNKAIYKFHVDEIIKLVDYAIYNQQEGCADPVLPKNPYTNEEFSVFELNNILNHLTKIGRVCYSLQIFKLSSFCTYSLAELFGSYLNSIACKNYIKDIDDDAWNEMLSDFIDDCGYTRKVCLICMKKKIADMRALFTPLLIRNLIETNLGYSNSKSFLMFNKIIESYNLKVDKLHHITHRKRIRVQRRNNNQLVVNIPAPVQENNLNDIDDVEDLDDSESESLFSTSSDESIEIPLTEPEPTEPVFSSEEIIFTDISSEANQTNTFNINPDQVHFSIGTTEPNSRRRRNRRWRRRIR